jgi:hypothetical protein
MDKERLTGMIPLVVAPFNERGVNFSPGPEYADANRCFGIATSIARTPGGRLWCGFTSGGNGEGQHS